MKKTMLIIGIVMLVACAASAEVTVVERHGGWDCFLNTTMLDGTSYFVMFKIGRAHV